MHDLVVPPFYATVSQILQGKNTGHRKYPLCGVLSFPLLQCVGIFIKWLPPLGGSKEGISSLSQHYQTSRGAPALSVVPAPFPTRSSSPGLLIADFLSAKATVQLLLFPLLVWPSYAIGILASHKSFPGALSSLCDRWLGFFCVLWHTSSSS